MTLPDVHLRDRHGQAASSMPSSHAANWFSAALVLFIYYRRTIWVMLPMAVLVGLSRIYNGVHYPSDVLAGAFLAWVTARRDYLGLTVSGNTPARDGFPRWHAPTAVVDASGFIET